MKVSPTICFGALALALSGAWVLLELYVARGTASALEKVTTTAYPSLKPPAAGTIVEVSSPVTSRESEPLQSKASADTGRPLGSTPLRLSIQEGRELLEADPELRASIFAFCKAQLMGEYHELLSMLSESEADAFLDIMTRGSSRLIGGVIFDMADRNAPKQPVSEQLKGLLGEDRYERYREFTRGRPAREITNELTRSLYYTGTPLGPAQIQQISELALAALRDPALGPRHTGGHLNIPMPVWQSIVERASGILSDQQLAALRRLAVESEYFQARGNAIAALRREMKK